MRTAILVAFVLLTLGTPGVPAQDPQTDDHAEQDRLYLERLLLQDPAVDPGVDPLQAFLARADELIRDTHHRSASSEHYRVQTDDPRLDPDGATALLESFYHEFERFWEGKLELKPLGEPARVFLFYSFHKYNQLLDADYRFSNIRPKGHYKTSLDVMAAHTDADVGGGLADSLIHEAAHQLIQRRVYGNEEQLAPWLAEGLASYFGFTRRDTAGRFDFGKIGGKSCELLGERPGAAPAEARERLQRLQRRLRRESDEPSPVGRVLAMRGGDEFYGADSEWTYSVSWVLVHTLVHGDEGRFLDGFSSFLRGAIDGDSSNAALLRALGLDPQSLDLAVERQLGRMR